MSAQEASAGSSGSAASSPTVFFLSDYGLSDAFVGIVHGVLRREVPSAVVIDLTHGVPPFDVRTGSETLLRAVPHLGPGTILAVVDPLAGGNHRRVAVEVEGPPARWFVAPDNGLVVTAANACGGIRSAWELAAPPGTSATVGGVFAHAAAALAKGAEPSSLGSRMDPAELVQLAPPLVETGADDDHRWLRAEVTWIDRFGNVQLAATPAALPLEEAAEPVSAAEPAVAVSVAGMPAVPSGATAAHGARRVRTFGDLDAGELGIMTDANGHLALVVREGSAQAATGARTGDLIELSW